MAAQHSVLSHAIPTPLPLCTWTSFTRSLEADKADTVVTAAAVEAAEDKQKAKTRFGPLTAATVALAGMVETAFPAVPSSIFHKKAVII